MKNNGDVVGVIMVGPPGCGKDTQAKFLEKNGVCVFGTGDFLRKRCLEDSLFNQKYGKLMSDGGLLPDDVVVDTFYFYFNKLPAGISWVMNGFPRTVGQYERVRTTLLAKKKKYPIVVLLFKFISREELLERVASRKRAEMRNDDKEDSFLRRIEEHNNNVPNLLRAMKKDCFRIAEVDASMPVEILHARIDGVMKLLLQKS